MPTIWVGFHTVCVVSLLYPMGETWPVGASSLVIARIGRPVDHFTMILNAGKPRKFQRPTQNKHQKNGKE